MASEFSEILEMHVEETWTPYPAHLDATNPDSTELPSLSFNFQVFCVPESSFADDPDGCVANILDEAALGGQEEPYSQFGVYAIELHERLASICEEKAEGAFYGSCSVAADSYVIKEAEGHRWNWKYDPESCRLEWSYESKGEEMPAVASEGDTLAARISESARKGYLQGKPRSKDCALNASML